jgi:hypothetical protein
MESCDLICEASKQKEGSFHTPDSQFYHGQQ